MPAVGLMMAPVPRPTAATSGTAQLQEAPEILEEEGTVTCKETIVRR